MASELKSYTPTAEESLRGTIFDILSGLGMGRLPAQHFAEKGAGVAEFLPVVGNVLAGQDLQQAQSEGSLLGTMLNAAGAAIPTPGAGKALTGTAKMLSDYVAESAAKAKELEDLLKDALAPVKAQLSGLAAVDNAVLAAGGSIPPPASYLDRFKLAVEDGDINTIGNLWNIAGTIPPSQQGTPKFQELVKMVDYVYGQPKALSKIVEEAEDIFKGKVPLDESKLNKLYQDWWDVIAPVDKALAKNPGASIADIAGMPELNALAMGQQQQPYKFEAVAQEFTDKWRLANTSALERAKQLGYTQPTYHGTGNFETNVILPNFNEIQTWDPQYSKISPKTVEFYSTSDSELANLYTSYRSGTKQILPLLVNPSNYLEFDAGGRSWTSVNSRAVRDAVRGDWSGVAIRDVHDTPQGHGPTADVFVTLDPSTVRSRFANFDPKKIHLNDLLAGLSGIMLGGAAVGGQDAQ